MDELSMRAKAMPLKDVVAELAEALDYAETMNNGPELLYSEDQINALGSAIAILQALQEAGAADAEQVKDLLHDYNGLAKQYQGLHDRFEVPRKPAHADGVWHCPRCNKRVGFNNTHCHWCGQKIKWG